MTYKVKQTADRGRCIVTTAGLLWGDVALEAMPYAAVLYDDQVKRCHYSLEATEVRKCVRAAPLKNRRLQSCRAARDMYISFGSTHFVQD